MDPGASSSVARKKWELENNIESAESDAIFQFDAQKETSIQQQKLWTKDPNYFKNVRISALALLKMVVHARSGGNIEIMGIMQGKTDGDTFIVMDSFALPVEGTETRVNAQADAYEYMVNYVQTNRAVRFQSGTASLVIFEGTVSWMNVLKGHPIFLGAKYLAEQLYSLTGITVRKLLSRPCRMSVEFTALFIQNSLAMYTFPA